ncbi:MAG: protein kinase [Gemmatimonadales bacterium]
MTDLSRLTAALSDRYTIEQEVGAGGMATVYLAHDVKHDRKVALKVLRPELAAVIGAERFLVEIKTTANLQHPHILPLFDSGEADSFLFYVMPFIEGESLRDRLEREKQLPIDDAVRLASEVASALDYAHRHDVIHRDIKPENILLHDGQALVADFGIALAASKAGGTRMTETGMSLGTPHYMSPEQAMGERELDARSDVYALGCVLYEMLTGEPPFTGPTAQAIVAKVMTADPVPPTELRKTVPFGIEAATLRALQKLPADRFTSPKDFAQALASPDTVAGPRTTGRVLGQRRFFWWRAAGFAAIGVLVGVLAMSWMDRPAPARGVPARFEIGTPFLGFNPNRLMTISPDGSTIVYVQGAGSGRGIRVRPLDRLESSLIPGVEGPNPTFSPDGRELVFTRFGLTRRVPLTGGQSIVIPDVPEGPFQVWADDGALVYTGVDYGIYRLPPGGGEPVQVSLPDTTRNERRQHLTDVLPGGRYALVYGNTGAGAVGALYALDLGNGERHYILDVEVRGAWYAGHSTMVYATLDNTLYGVAFDPASLKTSGESVRLAGPVSSMPTALARVAVSRTGSVVYLERNTAELVAVSRDGAARRMLDREAEFHNPRVSPDGRRISIDINDPSGRDVWVLSLNQGTLSRETFDNDGHDAIWSADGRSLIYVATRDGAARLLRSDLGSTGGTVIAADALAAPGGWLADGTLIGTRSSINSATGWDIMTVGGGGLESVIATPFSEAWVRPSPDGHWLAYVSDESRRFEVYLRRVGGVGGRLQVSVDGGSEPIWSADGRTLYYRRTDPEATNLMAATLDLGGEPGVVTREALFDWADYEGAEPHANYDVMPGGDEFIMVRRTQAAHLILIQNVHLLVHPGEQ